ncbi:MAG TPA: GAF domain-containing protein [Povalibacter sp.]|uniref:ATP-binding protein n=1 Tax=Povalibacter sp. TaxID=1962978 RepID=UPI002CAF4768|nr:GAF domain-containing protein [Povalibacter sp.]HMN44181.1 GAF domain-containing protein [Povalibacter sp.]
MISTDSQEVFAAPADSAAAADFPDAGRLQELSTRLIHEGDVQTLYQHILDTALALTQADMASLQVFHSERGEFRLIAWKGHTPSPASFLDCVRPETAGPYAVAMRNGARVFVADIDDSVFASGCREIDGFRAAGIRAMQATPLVSRSGESLGVISTHWRRPLADDRPLHLFDVLARQTADLIERARSELRLRETARQKDALYKLADLLHRTRSLDDVYAAALQAIVVALQCDRASILLFDEAGSMRFVASGGLSHSYREAVEGHSVWRPTDPNPAPIHIDDAATAQMSESLRESILAEGIGALAFIPLVSDGQLIGKFMAYFDDPHGFSRDEMDLCLLIARQVAFAIERKRTEDALREADQRKDEFLAMLSHELRNPLAAITIAAQVLQQNVTADPSQQEARGIIDRQTARLTRLVDDLLEVSRITSGRIQLQKQRAALRDIVERAVESVRPTISLHHHALRLVVPETAVWLHADAARIEQVLINLLYNAAKYTDDGGTIQLLAECDGSHAVLRVVDNGIGIEPDLMPHIFELFTQSQRSLDRSQGGLGIGLSLVQRLVTMHDGTVHARSIVGEGSEFIVRLPVLQDDADAAAELTTESQDAPAPTLRILVVDDNADAARGLALLLGGHGYAVSLAYDGEAALDAVRSVQPHVVFLDIGLPRIDGYEVARRLRQDHSRDALALVALTGYGKQSDRERASQAGFDLHLVKPADVSAVLQYLSVVAAGRRERQAR